MVAVERVDCCRCIFAPAASRVVVQQKIELAFAGAGQFKCAGCVASAAMSDATGPTCSPRPKARLGRHARQEAMRCHAVMSRESVQATARRGPYSSVVVENRDIVARQYLVRLQSDQASEPLHDDRIVTR